MSFELINALYRSRLTVLALLKRRNYNITPFERFSTREIELMLGDSSGKHALNIRVEKDNADDKTVCHVLYFNPKFKKYDDFVDDLKLSDDELEKSEFLVLLQDEINDSHHAASMRHWVKNKRKVHFFNLYRLIFNPLDHILQPKFDIVPEDKHEDLLKALNCNNKTQLPIIRYHSDVVTRCLGLAPGDIIKITRPSESAGESIVYSVCGA